MNADRALEEPRTSMGGVDAGHFGWLTARRAAWIAWTCWVIGGALRLLQLWLGLRFGEDARETMFGGPASYATGTLFATTTATVGALIVTRRPHNTIGWLWVMAGLFQGLTGWATVYTAVNTVDGPVQPAITFGWIASIALVAGPPSIFALVLALFPDGHVIGRRWRIVPWLAIAGFVIRAAEIGLGRPYIFTIPTLENPYHLEGPLGDLLSGSIGLAIQLVALGAAAVSLWIRYHTGDRDGRRQIVWFLGSGVVVILAALPLFILTATRPPENPPGPLPLAIFFLSLNLPPLATLVAITRYRLYEIDRIVNRAVLYGLLTAILAGLFAGVITLSERIVAGIVGMSSDVSVVLSAIVVAIAYQPLRRRIEAWVDRRFRYEQVRFGAYREQLEVVLEVVDLDAAADRLLREAIEAFGATGGAVEGPRGTRTSGSWDGHGAPLRVRIGGDGDAGRTVIIGPRRGGVLYDAEEEADLGEMATLVTRGLGRRS